MAGPVVVDFQLEGVVELAFEVIRQLAKVTLKLWDRIQLVGVIVGLWRTGADPIELGLLRAPEGGEFGEAALDRLPVLTIGVDVCGGLEVLYLIDEVVLAALEPGKLSGELLAPLRGSASARSSVEHSGRVRRYRRRLGQRNVLGEEGADSVQEEVFVCL